MPKCFAGPGDSLGCTGEAQRAGSELELDSKGACQILSPNKSTYPIPFPSLDSCKQSSWHGSEEPIGDLLASWPVAWQKVVEDKIGLSVKFTFLKFKVRL